VKAATTAAIKNVLRTLVMCTSLHVVIQKSGVTVPVPAAGLDELGAKFWPVLQVFVALVCRLLLQMSECVQNSAATAPVWPACAVHGTTLTLCLAADLPQARVGI
jgi:hypothetical protein